MRQLGHLPVVNFAAGGIATPADAALMMQLGVDGIFVGSGILSPVTRQSGQQPLSKPQPIMITPGFWLKSAVTWVKPWWDARWQISPIPTCFPPVAGNSSRINLKMDIDIDDPAR